MPELTELTEAPGSLTDVQQTQPKGGRFRALLIAPGWGSSGYYSEAVLQSDGPKAWPAGTQMYLDHPTIEERIERPERSVRDLASRIVTDPVWEPGRGLVAEVQVYPQWQDLLNEEFAKGIGLSIRAHGRTEYGEAEGRQGPIVESIEEGLSVDWVTRAGAGGRVLELIESARAAGDELVEAVSDKPWSDFSAADYTIEQWRAACLIKPDEASDNKSDYSLPVKEPGGALNRNAVHAAAGAHGVGAVKGVSAEKKTAAAKALVGLYKNQLKEDPPAGLLKAAGMAQEEAAATGAASLVEGRNVGAWLESRIHAEFTDLADDMYGGGRVTRDERIALSSAIGDALDAFTKSVTAAAPQLYQRDLWDGPPEDTADVSESRRTLREAHGMTAGDLSTALSRAVKETYGAKDTYTWVRDNTDDWVVFSIEDPTDCVLYQQPYTVEEKTQAVMLTGDAVEVTQRTTYVPTGQEPTGQTAGGDGLTENAPGIQPDPTKEEQEGTMPELTEAEARALTEGRDTALAERDQARADLAEANTALAEARRETARLRATDAARPIATKILDESDLPAVSRTRALNEAMRAVPLTDKDTLDEDAFKSVVEEAVKAEQAFLAGLEEASGAGRVRGHGSNGAAGWSGRSDERSLEEANAARKELVETYKRRGMSDEAAERAAAGRY
ncbi:hypothetical protein [Actinoallomurus sp. CA-142502]|uniref:hypothetical protein n=1 Tax=Actinoallomurus sp. CA-142502 TaxID=3239885 RepID=UPI003D90F52D